MAQIDQSFEKNVDDYLPQIRRVVARFFTHQGDIDDLTQECCVRIIEKEHLWNPTRGSMVKWINAVVRNLSINRQKERQMNQLDHEVETSALSSDFNEDHIQWVLMQLNTLPARQKEILKMKYFDGLGVTAIAKQLNVSQPAISKQLIQSLEVLKKRARQQGLLSFLLPWNWFVDVREYGARALAFKVAGVVLFVGGPVVVFNFPDNADQVALAEGTQPTMFAQTGMGSVEEEKESEKAGAPPAEVEDLEDRPGGATSKAVNPEIEKEPKEPTPPNWAVKIKNRLLKNISIQSGDGSVRDVLTAMSKDTQVTAIYDDELPLDKKALITEVNEPAYIVIEAIIGRLGELGSTDAGWCLKNGAVYFSKDTTEFGNRWIMEPEKGKLVYIEIVKPQPAPLRPTYSKGLRVKLKRKVEKKYESLSIAKICKDLKKTHDVEIIFDIDVETDDVIDMKFPEGMFTLMQFLDILLDKMDPDGKIKWIEKDGAIRILKDSK